MNRRVLIGATLVGAGLASSVALAGATINYPVNAWGGSFKHGTGSVWDTRMEASSSSYIGCKATGNVSYGYVFCTARDAAGDYSSCISYHDDPGFEHLARAVGLVNEHSFIDFYSMSDGITCNYINVDNSSRYVQ